MTDRFNWAIILGAGWPVLLLVYFHVTDLLADAVERLVEIVSSLRAKQ